ncbi:MAG: prolyl oligopeptidase family serine peptidase [Ignavibacteriales bacterium]|nr:prolyl oligopeptidase family serine peptidase [Ignavibacteriales bacterium]
MKSRFILLAGFIIASMCIALGQTAGKKPLSHDVYDQWKRVAGESISNDGKWVVYSVEPQEGDAHLVIYNTESRRYDTIPRGMNAKISESSDYVVFSIKPFFAEVRKLKIAKKKEDDLPKDSLGIIALSTMKLTKIARVKSFKLPEKGSGWVAYQLEKELPDTTKKGKRNVEKKSDDADPADEETTKKEEKGTTILLRNLLSGKDYSFPFGGDYAFSKNGKRFIAATTGNDSTVKAGVITVNTGKAFTDTSRAYIDTLAAGKGKFKGVVCDDEGTQAAYVADRDTSKAKQRYYSLYYWSENSTAPELLADTLTQGLPKKWLVSENGKLFFSKDGKRLFLGTAPVPMPEDTTMNDEESAKLDVWNWQDPLLQPQQLKNLDTEKKRSYTAVVNLKKRKFSQLATVAMPNVTVGLDGNADVAVGSTDVPYRQLVSWDASYRDVYVVDPVTGEAKKIAGKTRGNPTLSPSAQYVVWYAEEDTCWRAYSLKKEKTINLSAQIPFPVWNELNDVPDDPNPHGMMGWTKDDQDVLIYDRHDIWRIDPEGKKAPENLTRGLGRKEQLRFRYVRLDPEEKFLNPDAQILLDAFSFTDKSSGFYTMKLNDGQAPRKIVMQACDYSAPKKADKAEKLILTRSTFRECPDLYVSDMAMAKLERISDINPQQKEYLWGSVELISWIAADGKPIEGLLFKPENFDPKKKYPLISYFYERNSDLLHRYIAPAPSASTVNISLFVSRGYVIFVPDIRYQVGYPGKGAYDCVIPGIMKLIGEGYVDSSKIAIQGQSWGGYQVAYLVAHSHMFAAAGAGAPVSNMTSAYGGIRWESGMSRMFQYEKTQSRIGATLWEKPLLYIENSALFSAPDITTPLLIMANDADGAVPWYQGIELFTALRRLGKPAWMLTYNGEAHNLVQRKNRKDLSVRMLQFFDHYLMGQPEPVWMTRGIPAIEKGKTRGYELTK